MKKIILLMVGVMAALTLCSCGAEQPEYVGEWRCYNDMGGGFTDSFIIYDDGTYVWLYDEVPMTEGTYVEVNDTTIIITDTDDGDVDTLYVDGNTLHSVRWNYADYVRIN